MPTKHKSHKAKASKSKKMTKSGKKSKSMTMKSSGSSSSEHRAYCMHERRKNVKMMDAVKKIITMKNGNKRAQMVGKCEHCKKSVFAFVKM
jgi:hypothetical protein